MSALGLAQLNEKPVTSTPRTDLQNDYRPSVIIGPLNREEIVHNVNIENMNDYTAPVFYDKSGVITFENRMDLAAPIFHDTPDEVVINKRSPLSAQPYDNLFLNIYKRPAITFVDSSSETLPLDNLDNMAVMKIELEPKPSSYHPNTSPLKKPVENIEYGPQLQTFIYKPSDIMVQENIDDENVKFPDADERMDSIMDIVQFSTLPGEQNNEEEVYDRLPAPGDDQQFVGKNHPGQYRQQIYQPNQQTLIKSIFKRNIESETEETDIEDPRFQTIDSLLTELDTDVIEKMVEHLNSENYAEFDDVMQKAIDKRRGEVMTEDTENDAENDATDMDVSASDVAEDRMDIQRGIDPALLQEYLNSIHSKEKSNDCRTLWF